MLKLLNKIIDQKKTPKITGKDYIQKYFSDAEFETYKTNYEKYLEENGEVRTGYIRAGDFMGIYLAWGYDTAIMFDKAPPPPEPQKPVKANG
jgi:hypothetical protein